MDQATLTLADFCAWLNSQHAEANRVERDDPKAARRRRKDLDTAWQLVGEFTDSRKA
jgi:hypothetical protein